MQTERSNGKVEQNAVQNTQQTRPKKRVPSNGSLRWERPAPRAAGGPRPAL